MARIWCTESDCTSAVDDTAPNKPDASLRALNLGWEVDSGHGHPDEWFCPQHVPTRAIGAELTLDAEASPELQTRAEQAMRALPVDTWVIHAYIDPLDEWPWICIVSPPTHKITWQQCEQAAGRFKGPMGIDYEFANLKGESSEHAGWLYELQWRAERGPQGQLWGRVELTQDAMRKVDHKDGYWVCPAFLLDAIDPKTGGSIGPIIAGVSISQVPKIDQLTPIMVSR